MDKNTVENYTLVPLNAELIHSSYSYLKKGFAVVPTKDKSACLRYKELPDFTSSEDCLSVYAENFGRHSEATGLAWIIAPGCAVLDLDSQQAVEDYKELTTDAIGIKTARGSRYIFKCPQSLTEIAGKAKFTLKPNVEIILEGMLCELPPGLHPSGMKYEWIKEPVSMDSFTALPESLLSEIISFATNTKDTPQKFQPEEFEELFKGLAEGEGRNEAAVRIGGHFIGKRESWPVIETTIRDWNNRNKPPMDDREMEGILKSLRKMFDKKQQELQEEIAQQSQKVSNTDSKTTVSEFKEMTVDEIRDRKETLKDRRLQLYLPPSHFVSVYCNWMSGITDGYSEYQSMGALWLISSFCNYNVETRLKQETVRPNIVVTLLGRSTTSRKTTAVNKARQIHESVTGEHLPNEDFSIEGYLESLALNPNQHHVRDEVAGFIAKIHKQYNEGFNELDCAIYDGQNYRKTLASKGNKDPKVFNVTNPYVTKLYATTPQNYCKYTEIEDFLCGKEFRTMFVFPTYSKERMALSVETQEDTDNWIVVLQRAKAIHTFIKSKERVEFHFDAGALEYYSEITSRIEQAADLLDDEVLSSAVGRSQVHILKLAMLIELGHEQISTTITKESLAIAANAVISYFIPTLMDIVSQMQEDTKTNMIEKVISVIRRSGGAVQHTKALHDSKLKSKDFAEVIETMVESETVEKVIEKKSKKMYYILTESKKSLDLSTFQPSDKNLQNPKNPPSLLVSHDKKNKEILETLKNITLSDHTYCTSFESNKIKEPLSCEVRQSNNITSLQNPPYVSSVGEQEISEILEIPEIFESRVVSEEELLRILEEEGI